MKRYDAVVVGIKPLYLNRIRAALSILGIFIGNASVLCMIAIGDGAKHLIAKDIEALGGSNQFRLSTRTAIWKGRRLLKHTTERYTLEDTHAIEAECPEVLFALPKNEGYRAFVTRQGISQVRPLIEGTTAAYALGMHWEVQAGRFLSENDIETASQVCILGANTAIELFGDTSAIGQDVKIQYSWQQPPVRMRVIGVMKTKGRSLSSWRSLDDIVCVPLTTHQRRFSGTPYIEEIIIFFKKDANIQEVIDSVKYVLRKRHRGKDDFINVWIPIRSIRRLDRLEKIIKISLGGIAGFSLFVSGIGIMNMCLVSVGEKTREIGLRKAVGARRIDIFYQFLAESICLCLCGSVLGIVGGWIFAHGMAKVAVHILPIVEKWPVVLSLKWVLISVIFSIFMGTVFGVYPAVRASRMAPIDALRAEN